uniref:Apple domain-containing protein n=1 Tax=Brugia malayi TaxID=6279 RepID=A0A8L7TIW3_BRUMA
MVLITLLLPIYALIFPISFQLTTATILECFKYYPNYYLGKNGNLVVINISSITSCLDHCLKSQLLYEFICRSAMVNKIQRECILSKWSPNLTFSKYHSRVVYTVFYQNICLPPLDQVQNFTIAPPRTTFSIPITDTRLIMANSISDKIKNHKSMGVVHDSTVNVENKKKLSFETVLHAAQHVPPPNTINGNTHRFIKSTQTTLSPNQKTTAYYVDYDEERSNNNGSNKDCDDNKKNNNNDNNSNSNNNKHGDKINSDSNNYDSNNGDDDDDDADAIDDDDDDHNDDYDNNNNNDDDGDDDDNIYNNNEYEDSDISTDLISASDKQPISASKNVAYRIAANLLKPIRTIKSVAIKPNPATIHRGFQHTEPLIPEITSSTTLLPLKTIITPFINNAITTIAITTPYASDNIITTSNSIDTDNSDITDTATITTTTTTGTTIIATTTTTTIKVTATTKTITSAMQFIPIPIEMLVREWNTTTKDSELSIQHQNYTLNIGILEQELNNRQMIRNGLIKELKCFHYFANKQLNGYRQEIIKQIGLQDCLHNCILRISFLCLSVNYNRKTRECILNADNRIINNVQLTSSKLTDYYEYVCLNARKQGLKAKNTHIGYNNIIKLRKCFSICENAVMYTLNGLVVDNIYTSLECLMTCAISHQVYKTKCYSVNWFKNTRTCYLHTTETDINNLKVTTASDFFLNNCADSNIIVNESNECEEDYCDK